MTASSPVLCSGNSATFIFWPGFFHMEWAPSWHRLLQFHSFPWNYDVFLTTQNGLSLRLCTLCSPSYQCEEVGSFKLYRTKKKFNALAAITTFTGNGKKYQAKVQMLVSLIFPFLISFDCLLMRLKPTNLWRICRWPLIPVIVTASSVSRPSQCIHLGNRWSLPHPREEMQMCPKSL